MHPTVLYVNGLCAHLPQHLSTIKRVPLGTFRMYAVNYQF